MSTISYFSKAKEFSITNSSLNTFITKPNGGALQRLEQHAASGAMSDSDERYPPPLCHPGTRTVAFGRIRGWFRHCPRPEKGIMWVHGPAGYGKTTIAQTTSENRDDLLADDDDDSSPVGATFFFWRSSLERSSPARFIVTLAYQLAVSIPEILPFIEEAIDRDPIIFKKALEIQLTRLIVEPFQRLDGLEEMSTRLIIIDGLDECINSDQECLVPRQYAEERERVQIRVLDLVYTLNSKNLPLSFLIFSRPEPWIKAHIESEPFKSVTESLDLYETDDHLADAKKYLRTELCRIARSHKIGVGEEDEEWPGEGVLLDLVGQTGGSMLYAATLARHIDDPYEGPERRLQDILHPPSDRLAFPSSPTTSLYELYKQIIRSCPLHSHPKMAQALADMLALQFTFEAPITTRTALNIIDRLYGRGLGEGMRAVRGLHAVLRSPDSSRGGGGFWIDMSGFFQSVGKEWLGDDASELEAMLDDYVFISNRFNDFFVHSSFQEFLQSPEAAVALGCAVDVDAANQRLLSKCLDLLSSIDLRGDITESHHIFAVMEWIQLWRACHNPSREADLPPATISKLLSIDLTDWIVQATKLHALPGTNYYSVFATEIPALLRCSHPELQEYMWSSLERALPRLLQLELLRQPELLDILVELTNTYLILLQGNMLRAGCAESKLFEEAVDNCVFRHVMQLLVDDMRLFRELFSDLRFPELRALFQPIFDRDTAVLTNVLRRVFQLQGRSLDF